ncbi:MAG: von Willebrand factor type A domain-containing protein [Candidatus Cloacimonetes bacterium]|nr:von Willebrand factor type A domain-containing protein [Candidatus Cloacimonadota bacterium]
MKKFIIVALVLLVGVISLFAADTGTLTIKVKNEKGDSVPFAKIVLVKDGVPTKMEGETKKNGNCIIINIPQGVYDIEVTAVSYAKTTVTGVKITAGSNTNQKVTLYKQSVEIGSDIVIEDSDMAVNEVEGLAVPTAGTSATNGDIHVRGGKTGGAAYSIDGMSASGITRGGVAYNEYNQNINQGTSEFNPIKQNEFYRAENEPLSTFSIDVDTGSYSVVRKMLNSNRLPPKDIIRTEELINYFDYKYPQPKDEHPFAIYTELGTCPWNNKRLLAHIGLQGKTMDMDDAPASNLVFLLDTSGSMNQYNKLPLVKQSMNLLLDGLRDNDKISIVTYAGSAGLVLEPTSGENKEKIMEALTNLNAGGSTAGGAGIQLAYKTAESAFIKGGNNRIILCTDGDFNVGTSKTDDLIKMVEEKSKSNIFLTILGFGMDNLKDGRLEQIANKGNGTYGYIDNILEAKKVFVNELSSSLYTIAKDVKIQVEFNPAWVRGYRLIGYENRMLKTEDFRDDTKDAGELGAGHTVTAIYEIIPKDSKEDVLMVDDLRYQKPKPELVDTHNDELLLVKLRYKLPDGDKSIPLDKPLKNKVVDYDKCSESFRFSTAVVGYAMLLQDNPNKGDLTWKKVIDIARESKGEDKFGYRAEFIKLAEMAELMQK